MPKSLVARAALAGLAVLAGIAIWRLLNPPALASRPPIIIKGGSLEFTSACNKLRLEKQAAKVYLLKGAHPEYSLLAGLSNGVPTRRLEKLTKVSLTLDDGGVVDLSLTAGKITITLPTDDLVEVDRRWLFRKNASFKIVELKVEDSGQTYEYKDANGHRLEFHLEGECP